jgi:hypothetical protein
MNSNITKLLLFYLTQFVFEIYYNIFMKSLGIYKNLLSLQFCQFLVDFSESF